MQGGKGGQGGQGGQGGEGRGGREGGLPNKGYKKAFGFLPGDVHPAGCFKQLTDTMYCCSKLKY